MNFGMASSRKTGGGSSPVCAFAANAATLTVVERADLPTLRDGQKVTFEPAQDRCTGKPRPLALQAM
jgi:hypothetical protein